MEQLTVRILERDYRLSCAPSEKAALLAAVGHVDAQMKVIRDQGKIANSERIAVFAALNIASALLSQTPRDAHSIAPIESSPIDAMDAQTVAVADEEIARRMRSINALLDTALSNQEALF